MNDKDDGILPVTNVQMKAGTEALQTTGDIEIVENPIRICDRSCQITILQLWPGLCQPTATMSEAEAVDVELVELKRFERESNVEGVGLPAVLDT